MSLKIKAMVLLLAVVLAGCVTSGNTEKTVNTSQAVANYLNLAKGYLQQGYTEKAIRPLNRALELEPRSANVHGMLGMAYQMQGETGLAEGFFKKALYYEPSASDVHNNYGAFLFSENRLSEAMRQFSLAADDVAYGKRSRAFENMGVVALAQSNKRLAVQHFERALRLNGSLPRARFELASMMYEQGDNRRAWDYYQAFTAISRQSAKSLMLGINLAEANGEKGKAANYVLQLERLYPGSPELKEYRRQTGF